jgi:hypothetical protein
VDVTDPVVAGGISAAVAVVALCAYSRYGLSKTLARQVLVTQGHSRSLRIAWSASCVLSSAVASSVVLLLLATLIAVTATETDLPDGGIGIMLAVALGVVGNHIDRQMSNGWALYWGQVHRSLRAVLTRIERAGKRAPPCQRTRFNGVHADLLDWDPMAREQALAGILRQEVCTDRSACPGHVLPPRRQRSAARWLVGGVVLLFQSPVLAVLFVGWLLAGIALLILHVLRRA